MGLRTELAFPFLLAEVFPLKRWATKSSPTMPALPHADTTELAEPLLPALSSSRLVATWLTCLNSSSNLAGPQAALHMLACPEG